MKAAVFYGAGKPLVIEDVPTPEPGPGELRVRVAACGLCHTDLHYLDHGTPTFKTPPMILGHEIAGTVDTAGDDVEAFHAGDHVLIPAVLSCGHCSRCREGRENICENGIMLGNNIDGGFAEYIVVPAKDVVALPESVPLVEGAIIADAITTPYHAVVNRGRVRPGDHVLVLGCGGVGLNVVQIAAALGGRVVAVDVRAEKLELAKRFGAEAVIDASSTERLDREVRRLTGGGADIAFEAIGRAVTQEQGLASLRTGGRLVLVGYSSETLPLNAGRVMFRELEVIGSLGCPPGDYPRAIELVRQEKIRLREVVTHRFPLERIEEGFDVLRAGDAVRAVVTP